MSMKNREELMQLLQKTTGIPFRMMNYSSGVIYAPNGKTLADLFRHMVDTFIKKGGDRDHPLLISEGNLFYCALIRNSDNSYIMYGPVCPARYRRELLENQLSGIMDTEIDYALELMLHGPVISVSNLINTLLLSVWIIDDRRLKEDDIIRIDNPMIDNDLKPAVLDAEHSALENGNYHLSIAFERGLNEAIKRGDYITLGEYQHAPHSGIIGSMSEDPDRQARYTFITAATMMSRAAIEGGMDPERALSISDAFCRQMDNTPVGNGFISLYTDMMNSYISGVAEIKKGDGNYSTSIIKAMDYLKRHIQDDISMEEVAEYCGLSKRWLSKKFIAETGMTFSEYITALRLDRASSMLVYSDFSLSEISSTLRFSSQSYFSEQFKKRFGITPKKYRDSKKP